MRSKTTIKFENPKATDAHGDSPLYQKLKEYRSLIAELNAIYAINKQALGLNIKELKDGYEKQLIDILSQENQLLYTAYVRSFLKDKELTGLNEIAAVPALNRENVEIYKINTLANKYLDLKSKNDKLSKKLKAAVNENTGNAHLNPRYSEIEFLRSKLNLNKANMLFLKHRNQMHKEIEELKCNLEDTKAMKNDVLKINFVS